MSGATEEWRRDVSPEEEQYTFEELVRNASYEDLVTAAQGCTEWSCMYHGAYNRELARREREKKK
jgi:hypothetical protein